MPAQGYLIGRPVLEPEMSALPRAQEARHAVGLRGGRRFALDLRGGLCAGRRPGQT